MFGTDKPNCATILSIKNNEEENMSANKKPVKKTKDPVKPIAFVVIVVAAIVLLWLIVSNLTKNPQTAAATQPVASNGQPTVKTYAAEPAMSIDTTKQYFATVKMAKGGQFVIQLYAEKAPETVNSFVFLARDHYFDGVTFHRVLDGFMAQGGDPTGSGMGGPGYQFKNEDSDLTFDKAGVVAMANAGRDTNGSQFFITFGPQDFLNGGYTIFGQVVEGMDVVNGITRRDPDQSPTFLGDAIETITIEEK
jgi:peptidylprolyl isomerase